MLISVWKRMQGKKSWAFLLLAVGVLLLLLPGRKEPKPSAEQPAFSLTEEEKRMAAALSRISGAGAVTVVLSLDTSLEQEYARNVDSDRDTASAGSREEQRSQVVEIGDAALTVKYAYPRYRGALVIAEGGGSALRLTLTQAVSALTGLSSDRITVVCGK